MKASSVSSFTLLFIGSLMAAVSATSMKLRLQELQSPNGPKHSNGMIVVPANETEENSMAFAFFANDLVVPGTGGYNSTKRMGSQTGHCAEVWKGQFISCQFRFMVTGNSDRKGTFTAEGDFPNAELVITGGTGDFLGMIGSGTVDPPGFDGTIFTYEFEYYLPRIRGPWWW